LARLSAILSGILLTGATLITCASQLSSNTIGQTAAGDRVPGDLAPLVARLP
jgi:hypothetical protein